MKELDNRNAITFRLTQSADSGFIYIKFLLWKKLFKFIYGFISMNHKARSVFECEFCKVLIYKCLFLLNDKMKIKKHFYIGLLTQAFNDETKG